MNLKIFTMEFNALEGCFNDSEISCFLKDKVLISLDNYLIESGSKKYLTLVVTYSHSEIELLEDKSTKATNWEKLINESNTDFFTSLKNWRLEESKKQGLPLFIIFTNKQLADITTMVPETLNHLSQIDGIGPQKMKKYGEIILKLSKEFKSRESH